MGTLAGLLLLAGRCNACSPKAVCGHGHVAEAWTYQSLNDHSIPMAADLKADSSYNQTN